MFSIRRFAAAASAGCTASSQLRVAAMSAVGSSLGSRQCLSSGTSAISIQRRRTGTDSITSASVVIVDPELEARERDRLARGLLSSNFPEQNVNQRSVLLYRDVVHTVPYSLSIAVDSVHSHPNVEEVVHGILDECFEMVDRNLNSFNPESEVSQVNQLPVFVKHKMSPHLLAVMKCCNEVYGTSGSCFDPAVAPLVRKLRDAAVNSTATEADFVISKEEAGKYTLPNSFAIDLKANTIARKHEGAALDLGGVNKGYTVDCVVEKLNAAGFADVLFEWGGDCRASGVNVQRLPWAVGVVRPPSVDEVNTAARAGQTTTGKSHSLGENTSGMVPPGGDAADSTLLRVMTLNDEAICTSGDYESILFAKPLESAVSSTYDWQTRSLITPSQHALSQVSVKCYSCMYADALATACFVKRDPVRVRFMLENYRRDFNRVTDYAAYTREGERLAHMYEIACESRALRDERIAGSLPARVVVIGGGLAGCAAAIEAVDCGATVVLIEKEPRLGGNSAKATSGINGWGTRTQAVNHVLDNCKLFERDTFLSGKGGYCDPGLVRTLSVKSSDAISWLESFGIPLTMLYQLGGASRKRCHRAPDQKDGTPVPIGFTIMKTLDDHIRAKLHGRITVLNETAVTSLIHETTTMPDGSHEIRVSGVRYTSLTDPMKTEMQLPADAVVLATGGFSNDQTNTSLLREYAPQLFGVPTTNGTFATGDGVKMARALGATLVDMDKVQLHPTGLINPKDPANKTKYLGPEALRGSGGILLNGQGERFVNELDLRSVVSQAIIAQDNVYPDSGGSRFAYCVLSEEAANLFGINGLTYYWKSMGLFTRVDDMKALAELIGCPLEQVRNSLETYETLSTEKRPCPLTGKIVYPSVVGMKGPYYVAYVTPSIHYTMGGCSISPAAEVLMEHNTVNIFEHQRPILGLFGAGEVTGGVHGCNRLGGNSLLECVVFGKIAGDRAATILRKEKHALSKDKWVPVVVRESRAGDQFGVGSRVLRFNLPGSAQTSGLAVGEFIGIRGEWDGQQLIGYYSPINMPDDRGRISILARGDKGNLQEWISSMRPGDSVEMKACGGLHIDLRPQQKQMLYRKSVVRKFALIAGGSGVAPMLQIIKAALSRPYVDNVETIRLIYAAEDEYELTYRELLARYRKDNPDKFNVGFVLNNPPEGWTEGVGYVDRGSLQRLMPPPSKDLLVAICGPPVMQRSVVADLLALGYSSKLVRTIDEDRTF
ncbi:putative mitochondrial NADH-dependent fumarate reductase-like protein [Leptomonas pyrrhocoris]|uniref:fumarate reductase (NADH) n=1 Tax=Leptomonas pyrrhocoris TaxID=157538 RepID=A0A0M9GA54_LEPPY|nr:putative mitochondrial NADH-dependent fumarate reductase-like protein [Leptomonas pyrrhocoris]KPA85957.1 putative mitochondrial NADH-dependent fumarate reductase-like protein [Leptomonas pyrrhocoris]|eukprot:XP_015664396.1 putative mitochondrial NADH-dependent fumarate reductase-like protein [Leptomonas pyrrhocoris]